MTLNSLSNYKNIYMVGIGGVSMSGLAEHLSHFDFKISGSDAKESDNTRHLKELGIQVEIGHHPEKMTEADLVVYTAAIPKNDPEFLYAKEKNIKMMERSEFLGELTKEYKECICISGTHGKTTTTSMISSVFLKANLDPTISVGAYLKSINGNNRTGKSDYFILEACEYVDSFLKFYPNTEIILNIDNDHLDYFKNIENIKKSFNQFINRLDENGIVIANNDDENIKELIEKNKENVSIITYGIKNDANFKAIDIKQNAEGQLNFKVLKNNEFYEEFTLKVHGQHNVLNALATIATCNFYKIDKKEIKSGIESFTGANRRFEKIGDYKDCPVYDDYAHHPTEINATYLCSEEIKKNQTWAIFEPHTYSRTEEHLEEFAHVLSQFDHILLAEIYAAREENSHNLSSKQLEELIKKENPNCLYLESYDKIIDYLKEHVQKEDIIITIGAGTINKVGYKLIEKK